MRVHTITDEALGNLSYLVEVDDGVAVSVDPRRDVGDHLDLASKHDLTIAAVLETHLHADFVSGSRELAQAAGAEILAAADTDLHFPHRPLHPGDLVSFGRVSVEVLATPGHTPEHVAFLMFNGTTRALFSGGSLLAGGAGRTDLTGADRTEELARAQFASLRRLAALPDDTMLHPTHAGGSFCSTGPARASAGTIEQARTQNPLFTIADLRAFVNALVDGFGTYPRYFSQLRDLNRTGAPLLESFDPLPQLAAEEAYGAIADGTWLIDGRPFEEWARGHAENSVSIELRPAFASWLGWVVPFGARVVFMLVAGQVEEATRLARRIGYDRLIGWIPFSTWRDAGLPKSSIENIDPHEAAERSRDGRAALLDIRQHAEHVAARIPGASHLELGDIIAGKTPEASDVIAYCGHGERSATAASLLARRGIRVANLVGGVGAWREAGLPLER